MKRSAYSHVGGEWMCWRARVYKSVFVRVFVRAYVCFL
ncbi:hypothetical protein MAR_022948 [Mya arenaria]|uniref:Uncharacterized protein n=1 Tax=Mya arenaria TaxID=6604 RepID=A0ABY7DQG8_MYAAR|nr:hypothetical protein MAR_022948 [Mya arenaria]